MSEPFLGEVRLFGFDYAPRGWAHCNGQLLPINQNQALFSILGTMYGGNGQTNFALPDLRGRSPLHLSPITPQGTRMGTEAVTLTQQQLPAHNHLFQCSPAEPNSPSPAAGLTAAPTGHNIYGTTPGAANNRIIAPAGQSVPYNHLQPYLVINFCIALVGLFPSRD